MKELKKNSDRNKRNTQVGLYIKKIILSSLYLAEATRKKKFENYIPYAKEKKRGSKKKQRTVYL